MKAMLLAAMLAASVGNAAAADPPGAASGTFKSQDVSMEARSAFAFHTKAMLDDKVDVIVVAVSNARMKPEVIADYFDRRRAIDRRLKDQDTGVVYFEFRPDGGYRGFSYYFASGNGCGYCGGGNVSTVKLAGGRLKGGLKDKDGDRTFDVTIDVPVTSDDHGPALPPDGGAPGKAYLAYHAALVKRDAAAIRPLLPSDLRDTLAGAEKERKTGAFLASLARDHPAKSVTITRGYGRDKKALLLIDGESTAGRVTGEVLLVNEDGTWRVDDELHDLVLK